MKTTGKLLLTLGLAAAAFTGCKKDDYHAGPGENARHGVFVCNQGVFNQNNASISFYDPAADTVATNFSFLYNGQPFPVGDVAQSMVIHKGKCFTVVNNSGKIYVTDAKTNAHLGKIDGLTSPRYVAIVNDTKAYVTDLYSNNITIFNPTTLEKTGTIAVGVGTEAIVVIGNYAYTCCWDYMTGNQVFKIDTATDEIVNNVTVALQPNSMAVDQSGKLWVLSDGAYGAEDATLTRINPETLAIEQTFSITAAFGAGSSPSKLCANAYGNKLYFLNKTAGSAPNWIDSNSGVYEMEITATQLPSEVMIPGGTRIFYGLGIDPSDNTIYISDAADYQQPGTVLHYCCKGNLLSTFTAGISPGGFCFKLQ